MRSWSRRILVFVLLATVAVAPASAERTVDPTPLADVTPIPIDLGPSSTLVACAVGNTNPSAWAISSFLAPPEDYALVFDPTVGCSSCQLGFQVTNVHMILRFPAACTVVMNVGFQDAIAAAGGACASPATEHCASPDYQVQIPAAGVYDINLPITCGCADVNYRYAIAVGFVSSTCAIDLVTDNFPSACTSWNDYGTGWTDLASYGFPGNLRVYADAACCEMPIENDGTAWGSLKELFRD